jgi:DNA polymerase III epsilon subunit-like protein
MENTTTQPARPVAYVIGDTETTGLAKPIGVVEICLRRICPENLDVIQQWESLIDPEMPISEGASNVHGITVDMIEDEPTMAEFVEMKLNGALAGHDIVFIAHNAPYDTPLVAPHITNITSTICTLFWSRQLVKDAPSNKLEALREHFGFPESIAHRAAGDVSTTHQLLRKLLEISGKTLPQLAADSLKAHTIHVMPFGKHKGQLIMTLPKDYIEYMLTCELETNLRDSLKKALKVK